MFGVNLHQKQVTINKKRKTFLLNQAISSTEEKNNNFWCIPIQHIRFRFTTNFLWFWILIKSGRNIEVFSLQSTKNAYNYNLAQYHRVFHSNGFSNLERLMMQQLGAIIMCFDRKNLENRSNFRIHLKLWLTFIAIGSLLWNTG